MAETKTPPVTGPASDVADQLTFLAGETGGLVESAPGTYKLKIYHTRAFPWDDVFKALIYRGYKVRVTAQKADLFIEAEK